MHDINWFSQGSNIKLNKESLRIMVNIVFKLLKTMLAGCKILLISSKGKNVFQKTYFRPKYPKKHDFLFTISLKSLTVQHKPIKTSNNLNHCFPEIIELITELCIHNFPSQFNISCNAWIIYEKIEGSFLLTLIKWKKNWL